MFGYVKPKREELKIKDDAFYKATYCGICRAMKRHTGALSNITLSYDSVFLALIRMIYLEDKDFAVGKYRIYLIFIMKRTDSLPQRRVTHAERSI